MGRPSEAADDTNAKRACDICHGMKVKCVEKDKPPCKRCRNLGIQCTFDRRAVPPIKTDKERLLTLEGQMSDMQSMLQNITALLQAKPAKTSLPPPPLSTPAAGEGSSPATLAQWVQSHVPVFAGSAGAKLPGAQWPSTGSQPLRRTVPHHADQGGIVEDNDQDQDEDEDEDEDDETDENDLRASSEADEDDGIGDGNATPDPLSDQERHAPLRRLLQAEEAARQRKSGPVTLNVRIEDSGRKRPRGSFDAAPSSDGVQAEDDRESRKRRRSRSWFDTETPAQHQLTVDGEATDPVTLGIVTEEDGRLLFDLFFAGSAGYMPVFDPVTDTFDEIRRQSPLCLTAVMMVGQMSADAGEGRTSELCKALKRHAEKIAMTTLFSAAASIQIVQAMVLLASWGDSPWRPGNHAVGIAADMGLYRCLPHLISTGMGTGKTPEQLECERQYVAGARVWLGLTKLKLEMALNHGRPVLIADDETITHARRLLEHPLSIPTDSRLVSSCELLLHRQRHIQPFISSGHISPTDVDEVLRSGNASFDAWQRFWSEYYVREGRGAHEFMVSELTVAKNHSILLFNYHVLHGVRSRHDVACLPESRRHWLVVCLHAADTLVERMVQPRELANLRFANHYAFVALAFAAQYLLRLARILPGTVDLRRTVKNVTTLADKLDQFPGFSFRQLLHDVATRARRRHGIPPSRAPSPAPPETDDFTWTELAANATTDETAWLQFLVEGDGPKMDFLMDELPGSEA